MLDPCYRDTPVETAGRRLGCPVEWHGGYCLATDELRRHPGYRGPSSWLLARRSPGMAGWTRGSSGDAARTGRYDEQALKRVWHYVARFG